ncbi:MAG: hypothetical protein GC164_16315 [Phycisphaera sp.]|nr:hypothetical protein [Phycisphaera sp.]
MTGRENILRLLSGEKPAWMPCSINVGQWFNHHRKFNKLPDELRDATCHADVLRALGCDVFIRMPSGVRAKSEGFEPHHETQQGELGPRHITTLDTPHGKLQSIHEDQTAMTSSYSVEDFVKEWGRDRKAYLWALERTAYHWHKPAFETSDAQAGDDGVPLCSLPCSPLKKMHSDLGLDHTCLFVLDHPDDAKLICDLYWERVMVALREVALDPRIHAVCIEDNVDTPFYPPGIIEEYWVPYLRQLTDLMHAHRKRVFVHACGHLKQLKPAFLEANIDGLDGMPHPPLGDWTADDSRSMPERFIYDGGFSAHEQVTMNDDEVERFYDGFFTDLKGHTRMVFAAACQTAITTKWDRIKQVVRIARDHGGRRESPQRTQRAQRRGMDDG